MLTPLRLLVRVPKAGMVARAAMAARRPRAMPAVAVRAGQVAMAEMAEMASPSLLTRWVETAEMQVTAVLVARVVA